MPTNEEWRAARLPYLRGLTRPTKSQLLLMKLLEIPERSSHEQDQVDVLWKLEQVNARAELVRIAAYKSVRGENRDLRKARTRKLIQLGALVEKAGMGEDRGVLLGALREASERIAKPDGGAVTQRLKSVGDKELAALELRKKIPGLWSILEPDDPEKPKRRR